MDTPEVKTSAIAPDPAAVKSGRIKPVAWLTGLTALFACAALGDGASVGMGLGIIGVAGMVAYVCNLILKS